MMWDLSGKCRFGPSLRFLGGFGGTPTWNLQNICAKAGDFLRHGLTMSCGACPCSPEASLFAFAAMPRERQ